MAVQVKICGIKTEDALDAALEAGADYFGLVFYPPSPRSVAPERARELAERGRGRAKAVALLVDPSDADMEHIMATVRPDYVQLHGQESPERVRALKDIAGRPVIKAIKVASAEDAATAQDYDEIADIVLFDAKPSADAPDMLPGGNGVPFDWRALAGVKERGAFLLSGGLDADNVKEAIALTGAAIVDVSSGVERAPGEKDAALIRRFVAAAKSAGAES